MQFVHEDDLVPVIRLRLENRLEGVDNVAGDGTLTLNEMVRRLGNVHRPLPAAMLLPINHLAWSLRMTWLTEFPSPARTSCATLDRFLCQTHRDTVFTYEYDTQTASSTILPARQKIGAA